MRRRGFKLLYAYYLFHFKGFLKILWLLPISFPSDNVKVGSLFYPTDSRRPLWSEKAWNTNNHTVVPISRYLIAQLDNLCYCSLGLGIDCLVGSGDLL